jgi:hypothetical protein
VVRNPSSVSLQGDDTLRQTRHVETLLDGTLAFRSRESL